MARRVRLAGLASLLLATLLSAACASHTDLRAVTVVNDRVVAPQAVSTEVLPGQQTIRLMTLNVAHSRGRGVHQLLQDKDTAVANLDAVASLLIREAPDVVALQEADGPSIWSGRFDHVEYLARNSGLSAFARSEHVRRAGLSYGTAMMTRLSLRGGEAYRFPSGAIWPAKGFTLSTVALPGRPETEIDIVSLHLDPLRPGVRRAQVMLLIEKLRERDRPLVVMGDFNCEWRQDSCVQTLATELQLKGFQPASEQLDSFPMTGKRLDWILVSRELEFERYELMPDPVSDHLAVLADVRVQQVDADQPGVFASYGPNGAPAPTALSLK